MTTSSLLSAPVTPSDSAMERAGSPSPVPSQAARRGQLGMDFRLPTSSPSRRVGTTAAVGAGAGVAGRGSSPRRTAPAAATETVIFVQPSATTHHQQTARQSGVSHKVKDDDDDDEPSFDHDGTSFPFTEPALPEEDQLRYAKMLAALPPIPSLTSALPSARLPSAFCGVSSPSTTKGGVAASLFPVHFPADPSTTACEGDMVQDQLEDPELCADNMPLDEQEEEDLASTGVFVHDHDHHTHPLPMDLSAAGASTSLSSSSLSAQLLSPMNHLSGNRSLRARVTFEEQAIVLVSAAHMEDIVTSSGVEEDGAVGASSVPVAAGIEEPSSGSSPSTLPMRRDEPTDKVEGDKTRRSVEQSSADVPPPPSSDAIKVETLRRCDLAGRDDVAMSSDQTSFVVGRRRQQQQSPQPHFTPLPVAVRDDLLFYNVPLSDTSELRSQRAVKRKKSRAA